MKRLFTKIIAMLVVFTSFMNVSAMASITWSFGTDAGYHYVGEEQFGVRRFLFHADIDESSIKDSGIMFTKVQNAEGTVEESFNESGGNSNTFYADITDIPEGSGSYYALAYIETTDGTVHWSDPLECSSEDFSNNYTKAYDRFGKVFDYTDKFLYRIGNQNEITLGQLFELADEANDNVVHSNVTAEMELIDGTASWTCTAASNDDWKNKTYQFSGLGPVKITIKEDGKKIAELYAEIVEATNITDYSQLENYESCVLLNDIVMTDEGSYFLNGATLYGNGFTFDVKKGECAGDGYLTSNYLVSLTNATLDNIKITGAVYVEYGATASADYNRPTVLTSGSCRIVNSYISNCASPVRILSGDIEIKDSTVKGGNYANIDIRGGNITLDNVTTINQVNGNDTTEDGTIVVGIGIAVYYETVPENTTIEIVNGITQYNYLSQTQANEYIRDASASGLVSTMYSYSDACYKDSEGVKWVNTGILSMIETVGDDNITDVEGYDVSRSVSTSGRNGFVHTVVPTEETIASVAPDYEVTGQGIILPQEEFDFDINYVAKTEGSNDYCYEDNGIVYISMDEGDTFEWDSSILTVTKNDLNIDYTVTMNETDYTNSTIAFSEAGNYQVLYNYVDGYNYRLGEYSPVEAYDVTYEEIVNITVSVITANTKHAEFTFGSDNTASRTTMVGDTTYVMPDVSEENDYFGKVTIDGTEVYYTKDEAYTSDGEIEHGTLSSWYMCFPVFDGVVTITDYLEAGTSDETVTYNSSTIDNPSNLTVTGYTGSVSGSVSITDAGPDKVFLYQSAGSAPTEPVVLNDVLVYSSPTLSNNARSAMDLLVRYQYVDNAGGVYCYLVAYQIPETKECLTPETLITLYDGTQVEVQNLTGDEMLLAWDLNEGKYTQAPIVFIDKDEEAERCVVTLVFDDGTETEFVYEHGYFSLDRGEYIYFNELNAQDYIGETFVKENSIEENTISTAKLVDVIYESRVTEVYSPVTFSHLCYYVDGILSMPGGISGLFNIFEVDTEIMAYDKEKKAEDIEKYGLFTLEDYEGMIDQMMFEAFNGDILKVSIGKGYLTWEDIIYLAERYAPLCQ